MEKFFVIAISIVSVLIVLSPFFWGTGGILAEAATQDDPIQLEKGKLAIAKRWVKDELLFASGELSSREWDMRKELLTNRFIDMARRLDFIRGAK